MKKTTKWAALVAAVAVMGAMPGCSNTEEPEVDPAMPTWGRMTW